MGIATLEGLEGLEESSLKIPVANVSTPDEIALAKKGEQVAARSLHYPTVPASSLFSLFNKQTSALEDKVSPAEALETEPIQQIAERALPSIAAEAELPAAPDAVEMPVEEAIELIEQLPPHLDPVRELLQLGLKQEALQTQQIIQYKKEGDEHKQKINLLLDLAAHLPKTNSDEPAYQLAAKEKIVEIHEKLKAAGIDLFPGVTLGEELSKEQLTAAHSLITHHIDLHRTALQELFSTKISISLTLISAIIEMMKKGVEKDSQLKSKLNRLYGG